MERFLRVPIRSLTADDAAVLAPRADPVLLFLLRASKSLVVSVIAEAEEERRRRLEAQVSAQPESP